MKNSEVLNLTPAECGKDLLSLLKAYGTGPVYPMHMPGHKRNAELLGNALPWALDITEVDGFDNLHSAEGILAEGMERAARLYGSKRAFYLINGSTCGILAGIRACTCHGGKVLVARNCHMAVYHALELCGLRPVYVTPPLDESFGVYGGIPPEAVADALKKEADIQLAVITSPTYEGVVSDIRSISGLLHERKIPLLVDEAHGAHFGLSPYFPNSAVREGADIAIQSLHKTLPSLTQTALAHVCGDLVDPDKMRRQLTVFESSSPSYLLMGSIDRCIRIMKEQGEALLRRYKERLSIFDGRIENLKALRVLCHGRDFLHDHSSFFAFDPGKIVISVAGGALSGCELMELLVHEHNIQLEMAMGDYALAMTSVCDTDEGLERLADALVAIDGRCPSGISRECGTGIPPVPFQAMPIHQALECPGSDVAFFESENRISQEYVWAYPPGIPLLTPGERIDAAFVDAVNGMMERDVQMKSTYGRMPYRITVVS